MKPGIASRFVLASAAILLAGCFGGADEVPEGAEQTATPSLPEEEFGSIQGTVLDDEERPIPDATVRVLDFDGTVDESSLTDEDGRFGFVGLTPGEYQLTAEALFYKRETMDVDLEPGGTVQVTFTLLDVVRSALVVDVLSVEGYINCSVHSLGPYGPFNPCQALAEDNARFPLPLRTDLVNKGVVLELVWTPSTGVTGTVLELALCNTKDEVEDPINCRETTGAGYFQNVRGESPLVLRASDLPLSEYPTMEVTVGDGGQTSPRVPLTFQQSFELWMSLCYTENCPETYSTRPPQ